MQAQFLGPLLDWLAAQNNDSSSPAHGMLDLKSVAVAGHSRGGKIAALHYASGVHWGFYIMVSGFRVWEKFMNWEQWRLLGQLIP